MSGTVVIVGEVLRNMLTLVIPVKLMWSVGCTDSNDYQFSNETGNRHEAAYIIIK